jgi:hypothetical protein
MPNQPKDDLAPLGIIGDYEVDGDECFGLYIQINQHKVFVDIREDKYLELRKVKAQALFAAQEQLGKALTAFLDANPPFRDRKLAYIGLHSKNIEQGELFWEPQGYTLLKGLCFEPD